MDATEVQLVCEDLHACRVCLATDVRLEALYPGRLAETYEQLTGTTMSPTDGLPQHLCSMCAALLKRSAAFRSKCLNTLALLQMVSRQMQPLGLSLSKTEITMPLIRNLDKKYLKLPYVTSEMLTVSAFGDSSTTITNEIPVKQETQMELKIEVCAEDSVEDCKSTVLQSKEENIHTNLNIAETINAVKYKAEAYDPSLTLDADVPGIKQSSSCKDECDMFDSDTESNTAVGNSFDKSVVSENRNTVTDNVNKTMLPNYIKTAKKTKGKSADLTRRGGVQCKTKEALDEFGKTYNFDVIILTRNEQILDLEQSRKKCLSYQQGRFKCEECFRGFKSEIVYKNHMAVHDPASGSHVCEVCRLRYRTAARLKDHSRRHRLKYVCRECQHIFKDSMMAREHYKTHIGVRYECQHCGATFRKYASRINHIRIHHGATTCDICYEGLNGASGMLQHKNKAHKKTYQCASCDVHFDNAHAMTRHIGSSPGGACDPNIRACAKCGEPCASAEQLDEHVARAHPQRRPGQHRTDESCSREKKKWMERKCCCCPHFEVGKNGDGESVVPNSGSCPCGAGEEDCLCPLGSVRSCRRDRSPRNVGGVLRKPRWAHTGCCHERRLKKRRVEVMCDICAFTFLSGAALRAHMLIHTGEKPFQCSECHKRFRLKEYLQTHMNSHTGERPFKCSLCPKAFTNLVNKKRHQLVHTQARPHSCEVCAKTFKTTSDVKTHVRFVHMKVPQPPRVRHRKRKIECTDSE